jgi:hypothetical protein
MKFISIFLTILFLPAVVYASAPEACPKGQFHVRAHHRNAYIRSDGVAVKATYVQAHCKQLTAGVVYFLEKAKDGLPPNWPHRKEEASKWSEAEKARVIEVLEELPEVLLLKNVTGIYRLKKSKDLSNPASNGGNMIILYDSAFDPGKSLGMIFVHELSHLIWDRFTREERNDYRLAAQWSIKKMGDSVYYWEARKKGYVLSDGKKSADEDFANNLEYYLYKPDNLKAITPLVHKWLEKKYGETFKLNRKQR